jgi:formylglycine-generating enzyme required for sulfatase activity
MPRKSKRIRILAASAIVGSFAAGPALAAHDVWTPAREYTADTSGATEAEGCANATKIVYNSSIYTDRPDRNKQVVSVGSCKCHPSSFSLISKKTRGFVCTIKYVARKKRHVGGSSER